MTAARDSIEATTKTLMERLSGGDAAGVAAHYTDDAALLPPGAAKIDGAPFIDDHKEESLLSAWSLMQSEADYEAVRKELGTIAETHGIALPENAIYSPFSI